MLDFRPPFGVFSSASAPFDMTLTEDEDCAVAVITALPFSDVLRFFAGCSSFTSLSFVILFRGA